MIWKYVAYALIGAAIYGAGWVRGNEHGAEKYFALVGSLAGHAAQVKVITKEVTRTRTEFRTKEAETAIRIQGEIAHEIQILTATPNCAIPDADRVRLTDRIADDFNEAIRMYPTGSSPSEKVSAPDDAGLGATGGPPIRDAS